MALRAGIGLFVLALVGALWWQHQVVCDQAEQIGEVTIANAALSQSLETMRKGREADNMVVKQAAEQADRMTATARTLERQLQGAMHGEVDFDRVLSRGVTDALCLRWQSASGVYGGDPGDAAGRTHAGKSDSPAPGCAEWAGLTLRDVVEWSGLLLDHAGLERGDKAGLRAWAAQEGMDMGIRN